MPLLFTPIQSHDLDKVIQLFQAAAGRIDRMHIDHWQYWKHPPEEKVEWVKEGIALGQYFFVQNQEDTVGMVRILEDDLMYWGPQHDKARYIHSLVVKEKFKGRGFGRQILNQVAKEAKLQNCKYLRLDADSKNPKLCKYYEDQGFQPVGEKTLTLSTYTLFQKQL